MEIKKIIRFYPIAVLLGIFTYFYWSGKRNNDKFYKLKFNSLIVERNNWQLRTTEFYMQNGLRIDSNAICDSKLKLGDSITKEANSDLFKVYRRILLMEKSFFN